MNTKYGNAPPGNGGTLLERYLISRSPEDRNDAVEAYLGYAAMIARRFSGRGVDYDDLYQVASLSLLKALERYDPAQNARFLTYALPTMAGEVKNFFRDRARLIRPPRGMQENSGRIAAARAHLEQTLMRSPTLYEIAEETGLELEQVAECMASVQPLSLDTPVEDADGGTDTVLGDLIGREDTSLERMETRDEIRSLLTVLDEMERECIRLRFFENRSQRGTAEMLGVSQMSVSRIERRALAKMRARAALSR